MPTFTTPDPISATIELGAGDIRITASNRSDTVVTVRPRNKSNGADVRAAGNARVEYSNGHLQVVVAKSWMRFSLFGSGGTVDVSVDLPSGSAIQASSGLGDFDSEGQLGDSTIKTGMGKVLVGATGQLTASTGFGDVTVDRVEGDAHVTTGTGKVRIRAVTGGATVWNSNGDTYLGDVGGDLRIKAANGDISVDRAQRSVTAKTASGGIRVGEVTRGTIAIETAAGALEVGIREGSAAWLDVSSGHGRVHNSLAATGEPGSAKEKVEIRARTGFGDIVIDRSPA